MGKKRTFLYDGNPVDVDDSAVTDFLSKFPKAEPMESFVLGNDTVDVPASDITVVEKFKQQYPDAKPLFGEDEIPTITLDQAEVEGKVPTGPLKQGGGFQIGEQPKEINLENILKKYPALKKLGSVNLHADENFNREKTGLGSIEYFDPEQDQITYPNGFTYKNPKKGSHNIVYDPKNTKEEDVFLDMLHGMTGSDPKFAKLRSKFKEQVLADRSEDMEYFYNQQKNLGHAPDGKEQWVENYVDGLLRSELSEAKEGGYAEESKYNSKAIKSQAQEIKAYLSSPELPEIQDTQLSADATSVAKTPTDAVQVQPEPLTKQTRDVFMKHAGELPDKVKYDAKNSQIYINTFAKKLGVSPREMRKVYSDFIQNEAKLKELKRYYDQHPDDVDNLYKIAELHNAIGQHDLALEAYSALEGKLRKVGEQEALDPNNPNKRPDYVDERVMPAIAGQAYTEGLRGNMAEAQRLQDLTGYQGQEFESVGAGETLQPGNEMVYNDQGQMVPVGSPTPESEYLNGIAQAIENFTLFGPASEMTNVGFDKMAKHLPGAFSAYGTPGKFSDAVGVITGGVETLMGVAGMTTPAGALFAMPLVEVQNVAPEVAEWMMPIGKVLREYYRQQGQQMPELMENVTVLADLGMLGWLTHQGVEGAKGAKLEADFKKVFDKLPPEAVEQLAKVGEKRIEDAGGNIEQYGLDMKARIEGLKPQVEEIKTQAQATEVEPYNPPPHPESLRTVEEGASIVMNGEEGILERGDDGTWYHTTDNKSTQIKVEDKFNPTETLKDLGIEVLAEITPEQVARATADAEQVGRVEMNGKEYFVSLDRVGNENPTGDFVLEVNPDGTMINRFDSHPDPTFAKERKQKVINTFLESKGLPPRKLTAKVEVKPVEEVVVEAPVETPVEIPPTPQEILPANEPVSPAVEVPKVETPTLKNKEEIIDVYHGGNIIDVNSINKGHDPLYVTEHELEAIEYLKGNDGHLTSIKLDNLKIAKEEKARKILEEMGYDPEEYMLHELIDSRFEESFIGKNKVKKLFDALEKEGWEGVRFMDSGIGKTREIENIVILNPKKTLLNSKFENFHVVNDYEGSKLFDKGYNPIVEGKILKDLTQEQFEALFEKTETIKMVKGEKPPRVESEIETKVRELKQDVLNIGYEIGHEMEKNSLAEFSPDMYAVQNMPWIKPLSAAKETGGKVGTRGDISPSFTNDTKGVSVEKAGEILEQRAAEDGLHPHLDSQDWRNIVIDILHAGSKESYVKNNTKFGKERTRVLKQDMAEKKAELAEAIKDLENADWEKLGFDSKKEFKQHVRDIKSGKQIEQYEMDAMDVVAQMDDATVDRLIKELDENFPITEEEINKFYEKHNIEEGSAGSEVSSPKITEGNTAEGKAQKAGELVAEAKPVDTPVKITSKEKALKAVDDLESFLLNLPGIKDNVGGERMGISFKAEDAVKWFTETLRQGIKDGYIVKDAIERAIGKLKEHKTHKQLLDSVDESILRDNARKQQEDAGNPLDKPVEQQFGASHASVAEVRKVMGIEDSVPISERVKRDVKTVMEEGRELASKIDLEELSDQVIYDGRSLNANEQAALVFRETELYNEIRDAENSLAKAIANGNKPATDLAQGRIDIAYQQQTAIMKALDIAGSEMGLAFRMRQVMNKRDYSLVSLEKRWTQASNGAKMPADVRKQFSDMVKDLEAKNKRYEELLEVKDKQLAEQALANIQESMGRKPTDKAKAGEKLRRLADRIEAGKINKLAGFKASTGFDAAWDLSLTAVSETLRATGKLADAIESGIKKIRESDWYKELTDKDDFETKYREHLNKEYEKQDYDAPYLDENGDLKLDNQMLRDVVESLEIDPKLKQKNPQEFIDKVYEIVKEEFPDIERRKVQDAISGYGKKINSSLDDLQKEVNSLKRDLKGISGLEDAKAGKGVLKSGYSPPKPTPMQREQQREIHKELKNHPQDQASLDKKWATALDRTKSMLQNSITDLTKRISDIKAGTAIPKTPREKLKLDHKAEMMKEVVDDLKKQLVELEGKKTLSIEQRIDMAIQGAERTRELYERRTKEIRDTGTYTRETPAELSSPELTIARQIRDAAKAEYDAAIQGSGIGDAAKAARDLSASEKRVAELENKIKKNQIGYAAKAQRAMFKTPELEASLAKEKALKDVINTMRQEQGLVESHARDLWKARKQRQVKEIERRIRQKDYAKKVKPELELDIEMERLQAEMDRKKFDLDVEIEKEKYRNLSGRDKRYEMWLDIVNAPKSLMASMDFSAPLRQGAILSSRHPLLAAKTFKNMFKHWASEEYATNWHSNLQRSDGYIRAKKSNLFISEPMARLKAAEERFSSNIAEKIPVWGRGVKASNRAYSGFLNELRMEVFNQHYEALQRNGFKGKQMQKELDAMAYLINNFTGRGSLGKAEIAAPLANTFFFAPRFVTSRFNTLYNSLTGYTIPRAKQGGRLITPRARMEAYKAVGAYITTGMSVLAMAKAAGADVEADPRSSDFGKIKIGDTRYDIWAGHQQIVVLLSKIAMQASKSPRTGKVTEFGSNDNAAYTTLRFLRTKLSPPIGTLVSAGMKKNVDGTPFTASGAAWDMITPLIFSDMKSMYEEEGASGVLRNLVPATFGVGVNTFEKDAIIKQSNLDKSSEKLMLERKYQPEKANDDEVYVDGEPYKIPEADMEKIKSLRSQKAGEKINEEYSTLQDLSDEEYASKVNSYYNNALKEARNEVLPDGWKNEK